MASGLEVFARHFGEEPGGRPDADSRHAHQDDRKRVRLNDLFNQDRYLSPLPPQRCELFREARKDDSCGIRANHHDRLSSQRVHDLGRKTMSHTRSKPSEACS